jgi:hypothetical protein
MSFVANGQYGLVSHIRDIADDSWNRTRVNCCVVRCAFLRAFHVTCRSVWALWSDESRCAPWLDRARPRKPLELAHTRISDMMARSEQLPVDFTI